MFDWGIESQCSSEQEVYAMFKERHKKKLFAERIWNNIDEMEYDDLPTNKDDDDNTWE